jgi:hypothetical protein
MSEKDVLPEEIFDVNITSGKNYDRAEFQLWIPKDVKTVKGV